MDDSEHDEMFDKGMKKATQHAHVPGSDDVNEEDLELTVEDDSETRQRVIVMMRSIRRRKRRNKWCTSSNLLNQLVTLKIINLN